MTAGLWGGSTWGGAILGPTIMARATAAGVGPSPFQSSVTRVGPDPWEGGATAIGTVPDRGTVDTTVLPNYSSVARMR
jgi:hypothetical protein